MDSNLLKVKQFKFDDVVPFIIVALFWGITDVFIGRLSKQSKQQFQPHNFSPKSLIQLICGKRIFIFMGINQLGSILYGYLLGIYPEHYSSLLVNSLTILISFIFQLVLRKVEKQERFMVNLGKHLTGIGFVIFGIILMII